MRFLVVSDSHGNRDILEDIANTWQTQMDAMFHCGDSELLTSDSIWEKYFVVGGNMDFDPDYPENFIQTFGEDTIFMTHGHLYGINFSFNRLDAKATQVNAV
jgi:putative phosphoesterase